MSRMPKMFPAPAAIEVAQIRSLRHPHSAARSIRPPSRGKAGTRLKAASVQLRQLRYHRTPATAAGPCELATKPNRRKNRRPRTALATGPANAIRNSLSALVGSLCISATPPKIKRVMPDRHTKTLRHCRMGHFVEDDRKQEAHCRNDRHRPIGCRGEPGVDTGEDADGQTPGDEYREQEPGGVDIDVKPK